MGRLEIRLTAFRRSTIPQKQFIIIIISLIWTQDSLVFYTLSYIFNVKLFRSYKFFQIEGCTEVIQLFDSQEASF